MFTNKLIGEVYENCYSTVNKLQYIYLSDSDTNDLDVVVRFVSFSIYFRYCDFLNNLQPLVTPPKHGVLVVEPGL